MRASTKLAAPDALAGARCAWQRLRPDGPEPEAIQLLVRKEKTTVCRLVGSAAAGYPVIAKRTRGRIAAVERNVYERILPRVPLTFPRWYGSVDDAPSEFCWLFLEDDAGDSAFSPDNRVHRALAACWVAVLHAVGAHVQGVAGLRQRGACEALERLRTTRERILGQLGDGGRSAREREALGAILTSFDVIEGRWEECAAICDEVPRTLVHGDFTKRNLRVRPRSEATELLVLDWEHAGFGFPGADLLVVDPVCYARAIGEHGCRLDAGRLARVVRIGRLFRCLAEVDWESRWLAFPPLVDHGDSLGRHASRLGSVAREAGWAS